VLIKVSFLIHKNGRATPEWSYFQVLSFMSPKSDIFPYRMLIVVIFTGLAISKPLGLIAPFLLQDFVQVLTFYSFSEFQFGIEVIGNQVWEKEYMNDGSASVVKKRSKSETIIYFLPFTGKNHIVSSKSSGV